MLLSMLKNRVGAGYLRTSECCPWSQGLFLIFPKFLSSSKVYIQLSRQYRISECIRIIPKNDLKRCQCFQYLEKGQIPTYEVYSQTSDKMLENKGTNR